MTDARLMGRRRWALVLALFLLVWTAVEARNSAVQATDAPSSSASSSSSTAVGIDADIPATPRAKPFERSLPRRQITTSTTPSISSSSNSGGASDGFSGGAIAVVAVGCAAIVGVVMAVAARGRFTAKRGEEALFADLGDENSYFSDYAAM